MAKTQKPENTWAVFLGMGFELTALVLVGVYLGRIIDQKYGWNGMGVLAGSMLGLVIWMVHFFLLLKQVQKDEDGPGRPPTP